MQFLTSGGLYNPTTVTKIGVGVVIGGLMLYGASHFKITENNASCNSIINVQQSVGLNQSTLNDDFDQVTDEYFCDVNDDLLIEYSANKKKFTYFNEIGTINLEIEDQYFSDALKKYLDYFDGTWPPKTQFNDWSDILVIYRDICDKMPSKLCRLNNIKLFRNWLNSELNYNINNDKYCKLLHELEIHFKKALIKHNAILFSFLGCITKLMHAYRWGILPLTPNNLSKHENIESFMFPKYLIEPFYIICNIYDLPYCGCTPNLLYATSILSKVNINKGKNIYKPNGIRFFWNDIKVNHIAYKTEENTFNLFMYTVCNTNNILLSIAESIRFIFDICKNENIDISNNKINDKLINIINTKYELKYIELLINIEKSFYSSISHFGHKFKNNEINPTYYIENVTAIASWNIDNLGGPSAAQQLTTGIIDIFILNNDNEINFNKSKKGMLGIMVQLLDSLQNTINLRERIMPINCLSDKIQKKFYKIASRIRGFRIVHRNKVSDYLKKSNAKQSSTGNLKASLKKNNIKNGARDSDPYENDISDQFYKSMTKVINSVEKTRNKYISTFK